MVPERKVTSTYSGGKDGDGEGDATRASEEGLVPPLTTATSALRPSSSRPRGPSPGEGPIARGGARRLPVEKDSCEPGAGRGGAS